MKTYWLLGSCVAAVLAVAACGDESGDGEGGGEAGSGAEGGTSGASGSGEAGASGTGMTGGASGNPNGGTAGTDSMGGAGGDPGGGAGSGGESDGGETSGGTAGAGMGGMHAGAGSSAGSPAGAGGALAGAGGALAGAGAGGTFAGAGGGGGSPAGAGGSGGAGAMCTAVSPSDAWTFRDLGGAFGLYEADIQPELGTSEVDYLQLQIFGAATGTFQLGQDDDANYETCSRCFFVVVDDSRRLFATSGTLVISQDSAPVQGEMHATVTNATFVEVTIDTNNNFHSTPVPNGLCTQAASLSIDVDPPGGG